MPTQSRLPYPWCAIQADVTIDLLLFRNTVASLQRSVDHGRIPPDRAHQLTNRLARWYANRITTHIQGALPCSSRTAKA